MRDTFTLVTKVTSVGGLQKRNGEAVETGGSKWRREGIGCLLVGVAAFFEIERITVIRNNEDDVGEFTGFDLAGSPVAIDFLMFNVFGGGELLKVG